MTERSSSIQGLHHITLCTATAQGDVDFFVKVMGQRFIKQTLFYDGKIPIYHLYFSDADGTPGTVMTTFPMRRTGLVGRKGSGQFTAIAYSVPPGSLDFWREHFRRNGIAIAGESERFGEKYLRVAHAGIDFEVVEDPTDQRKPWKSDYVPERYAVRGFHNWTVTVREQEDMDTFMHEAWSFRRTLTDGLFTRYEVAEGGGGKRIDILHAPDLRQGTWTVAEGIVHHGAFDVPDYDTQMRVKLETEGMGFTDFSDRKNRGYFESTYVRTPGGAMFEATKSLGFKMDETEEELGTDLKISPQFDVSHEELKAFMQKEDPIHL
ncbi:VOC family protein [Pigmentiphaga kullae]|uniref:Hydroquinone 1,2-dioxygenase/2,6-dichloro-p-hydroquinone 1,2-dioxygenase/glyoxalase family protein n=1 Tax=Pigmentiphaga kullae TaxID=151784 RepID=A0A4Q7NK01_9BURK|nr:VOC family protein [Pigmentiphaga kullae]RZS85401.1 hydroquinone 1,2-dioxygenase/2,6-dichloro-p-hydroquinone 1,2-dioxygenase/glyoxalase family protein [Pigmentiphaga kullae]